MIHILRIRFVLTYFLQGVVVSIILLGVLYFLGVRQKYITPLTPFIILSGSMFPSIPVGSIVLSQSQPFYLEDDIITFTDTSGKKSFTTHRIETINRGDRYYAPPTYATKGDANKSADMVTIHDEQIVGKVVFIIPWLGYGVNYIKTPKGFLFFIIIPATIIIYEELKSLKNDVFLGIRELISKKKRGNESSHLPFPFVIIILPLVASLSFAVIKSGSFLKDVEQSIGNVITATSSSAKPDIQSNLLPSPTSEATSSATPPNEL